MGTALSARAARQLEAEAGIPSQTVDRFLTQLDRGELTLDGRSVVVVDEAAMVDTRRLARLLPAARAADAKVVLVGDHRQLPPVGAGGAFVAAARRLHAKALVDNRRQDADWEREALARLRVGDAEDALDAYRDHGRVIEAPDADSIRRRLIDDWDTARRMGEAPLILAATRADAARLNRLARARVDAAGGLGPHRLHVGGRELAVGDRVVATRNDYTLGVTNGTVATITDLHPHTRAVTISDDDATEVRLPAAYLDGGGLDYGHGLTVHKAQGLTAADVLVLADDTTFRELGYTAMSRGGAPTACTSSFPTGGSTNATSTNDAPAPNKPSSGPWNAPKRSTWRQRCGASPRPAAPRTFGTRKRQLAGGRPGRPAGGGSSSYGRPRSRLALSPA